MTATAEAFEQASRRFRPELLAYCYRMLGSVDEAEDVVQDIYLNAWRAYDRFEGRSSLRTWLYRIARHACLRAAEQGRRRPLPSGMQAGRPTGPDVALDPGSTDIPWLQPIPDALIGSGGADPATEVEVRQSVRLALVAALQHLPPRQRAVLILREVLRWRASEVAELLDTTRTAVDSALQRARAHLAKAAPDQDAMTEPVDPGTRDLLDRYAKAFETADVDALTRLLTEDAYFEMPPYATWFAGRAAACGWFATKLGSPGEIRLVPTAANGQPAFALYVRDAGGFHAHAVQVLSVRADGIAGITQFIDPALFATFALPTTL